MKFTFWALLALVNFSLSAQKLPKSGLLEDLTFLNKAIQEGHPVNYTQDKPVHIHPLIDSITGLNTDSISANHYRLIIGKALQYTECIHTNVSENPLLSQMGKASYFPLRTVVLNQRLFICSNDTLEDLQGREVTAINNVSVREVLIPELLNYTVSDGGTEAWSLALLNLYSSYLISFYLDYPDTFHVDLGDESLSLPAASNPLLNCQKRFQSDQLITRRDSSKTVVITLQSFDTSDKTELRSFFKSRSSSTENLILDLRGNTGGNRKMAVWLTQQLVDTSFEYSIVQPKELNTPKYLDGTGKFQFFLSRLKYNLGDFLKGRKTEGGRTFTYSYRPSSQTFKGQVYVLTDGFTCSSATMVCSWLKQHSQAVFIGSQTGGGYNGNNGGSFPSLTLPYSQMKIRFAVYRLVLDGDSPQNEGLLPDYPINYTIEDVLLQRDLAMEKALSLLATPRP